MNKVSSLALVTGASSGIGLQFARRLLSEGYDLIAVGRRKERLESLVSEFPQRYIRPVVADLSTPEGINTVTQLCRSEPLTLLVNNAGVAHYMSFTSLPAEKAQELLHVKVVAPTMLAQAAIAGMTERKRGTVINVAGMLAFGATAPLGQAQGRAAYVSSLSYLLSLTLSLHEEFKGAGIKFQVLCPGIVATEFHQRQGMDLSALPRMSADDVVSASLHALALDEIVCAPGVNNPALMTAALQASLAAFNGQAPRLADRYQSPS
ncbi:short-chain dehydrogenase [Izhakiella australiensis]|uniref:Short-chain dehydrogenase n=1 Tax=Izhakiella australiensis TaxID=1926881 RepID=A0A1S8YNA1_9GAMM|nr:SDR family NAD(P)-dependent oxidoreductase [Izhakiella australiensis]OON40392.1 short-chain dehydrogenase [Izhakiella australiensis]